MARCDVCGNDYDKTFQVIRGGQTHTYDSFECAIHALAPVTESKPRGRSTAVLTVPGTRGSKVSTIGRDRGSGSRLASFQGHARRTDAAEH
jgi:hypothetical protein